MLQLYVAECCDSLWLSAATLVTSGPLFLLPFATMILILLIPICSNLECCMQQILSNVVLQLKFLISDLLEPSRTGTNCFAVASNVVNLQAFAMSVDRHSSAFVSSSWCISRFIVKLVTTHDHTVSLNKAQVSLEQCLLVTTCICTPG